MAGRLASAIAYYVVVVPVAAISRLLGDPLRRRRPASSNWVDLDDAPPSLRGARRML